MGDRGFNYTALKLCSVFAVVYALQYFAGFEPGFNAAESPWWKFFTSIFGHGDLQHLLNNVFFIALFGSIYEQLTSSKIFTVTFFVSAVFANLSAFFFFPTSTIIGASGGGMGLMAALAVYRPNKPGLALGVPVPMWAALVLYILVDFAGLTGQTSTANEAHLLGTIAGGFIGYRLRERGFIGKNTGERKRKKKDKEDNEEDLEEFDNWQQKIRDWEDKYMLDKGK